MPDKHGTYTPHHSTLACNFRALLGRFGPDVAGDSVSPTSVSRTPCAFVCPSRACQLFCIIRLPRSRFAFLQFNSVVSFLLCNLSPTVSCISILCLFSVLCLSVRVKYLLSCDNFDEFHLRVCIFYISDVWCSTRVIKPC